MPDRTMITFDANGTLFKSRENSKSAFISTLADRCGIDRTESEFYYNFGTSSDYSFLFEDFAKTYGNEYASLKKFKPEELAEIAWDYQRSMPVPGLYEDAREALDSVGSHTLYVVSRSPQDVLDGRVIENGLEDIFPVNRRLGSDSQRSDRYGWLKNISSAPFDRKFFVGDEYGDMRIARELGMGGVAIMRPYEWNNRDPKMMEDAGADYVLGDLRELKNIAQRI